MKVQLLWLLFKNNPHWDTAVLVLNWVGADQFLFWPELEREVATIEIEIEHYGTVGAC